MQTQTFTYLLPAKPIPGKALQPVLGRDSATATGSQPCTGTGPWQQLWITAKSTGTCQEVNVPVPAATLLLTELFSLSGNTTFLFPSAFFQVKPQRGDFVDLFCDLLKETRNSCGYHSNKEQQI